jgi:purine-binding chemotaxis protein CheW
VNANSATDVRAVLLVRIGERQYGLPLASVERVLPMAYVVPLPDSGIGLMGMLNLHGNVMPVIDPRVRLGVPSPPFAAGHQLVCLRARTPYLMWVDSVDDVVTIGEGELSEVPGQHNSPLVPRVLRVGDAIVPVLAPTALEPRGSR